MFCYVSTINSNCEFTCLNDTKCIIFYVIPFFTFYERDNTFSNPLGMQSFFNF